MSKQISIGQFKRNISLFVNQVATFGERVILTSDGKPMSALISMGDFEQLREGENLAVDIQKWLADTRVLSDQIEQRRGQPVNVDAIWVADRDNLEQR
jgi:prevent-host-death family protein